MSKRGFYFRLIQAGRYCKAVRYTRALPGDSRMVRTAKQQKTNRAQQYINVKNATEKLLWHLCANFDVKGACFVTATFRDDALPISRKDAKTKVSKLLADLRREFKRQGRDLPYIYTVEGQPLCIHPSAAPVESSVWETQPWRDKTRWETMDAPEADDDNRAVRLHAHIFLVLRKEDYETVRAFWPHGHMYINPIKVNDISSFHRLAAYVTKERRNDQTSNGEKCYVPSLGLIQPSVDGHWCEDCETIDLPQGAEAIQSGSERDDYYGASMEYLYYRMPRPQQRPEPYKPRGLLKKMKRKKSS